MALDKTLGGPWHCIAGESFGHCVTYEQQHLCCESRSALHLILMHFIPQMRAPPLDLLRNAAKLTDCPRVADLFFAGTGRRLAMLIYKSCMV